MNDYNLPWRRCGGNTPHYTAITDAKGRYVVFAMADSRHDVEAGSAIETPPEDQQAANAQLIERAVNNHESLLAACRAAYACLRRPEAERNENRVVNLLNAAIAKAESKP